MKIKEKRGSVAAWVVETSHFFFSHLILSINSFEFMSAGFSPLDWSLGSIVENLHIFQYLSILDYSYFDNLFFFYMDIFF